MGVYRYIYSKSVYLKIFLCGCFVSLTQDKLKLQWLVNLYTHPNQIPGYASDIYSDTINVTLACFAKKD